MPKFKRSPPPDSPSPSADGSTGTTPRVARPRRPQRWKPPATGTRLLDWHQDLIPLLAQGYGVTAIAAQLGRSKATIDYARRVPEVRAAVAKVQDAAYERLGAQLAKQLFRDAPKNLAFLQAVRDAQVDGTRKQPEFRERVTAAMRLMDSALPRRTQSSQQISGRVGVDVLLSRDDAQAIDALARDAGIALPALPGPPDTPDAS